jgi:hypothetical protein
VTWRYQAVARRFSDSKPHPNPEQDFDFTVTGPDGPAYLELMEIAPLDMFGTTFDKAPPLYNGYDLAQNIALKILGKSSRYSDPTPKALYLLAYVTHWSFSLSETVVRLVQHELARSPHKFRGVFSFQLLSEDQGLVYRLWPVPPDLLRGFDPEQFKDHKVLNLDYAKFTVETNRMNPEAHDPNAQATEITFNYLKADGFSTSYVDGAFGGPMPSGNIYLAFFVDQLSIPQSVTHQVHPGGQLGALKSSVVATGIARELQTGIIMSPTTASNLIALLQGFLRQMEIPSDGK